MIGSVKRCLRKVLGNARLTFDEFLIVLIEVGATLNSRPLTCDYSTATEEEGLLPCANYKTTTRKKKVTYNEH